MGAASKITTELAGQKRRARYINVDELEILLPAAKRYQLVEEAKKTLYPELIFSTDIIPKNTLKKSILDRILQIIQGTSALYSGRHLTLRELSKEHVIQLIFTATTNASTVSANFAPFFAVGIHGESLISNEIYQDQRVVTVLPDVERD